MLPRDHEPVAFRGDLPSHLPDWWAAILEPESNEAQLELRTIPDWELVPFKYRYSPSLPALGRGSLNKSMHEKANRNHNLLQDTETRVSISWN